VHPPPPAPAQLAAPPPPPPAPSYADLLKQADTMMAAKQYNQAQALLNQAIQANSARPQAYNALAKLELYLLNLPSQAFEHYRAAIAKGGVATLRVSHEKGAGWLSISQGNAAYQGDGGADSFDSGAVKEAKKNKSGLLKGGKGHFAFHVKLVTGQNYNFEPTSQSPGSEVDFILSVLGG
jgi:tetratricopeptide (TPR) repeat protein